MELQSFSTPPRRHSRYEPSERFSERKRALFPTISNKENDSDSDLGHMSPLEISSSPERCESPFDSPHIADIFSEIHKPFSNHKKFSMLFENVTPIKNYKDPEEVLAPNTPSPVESPDDKAQSNLIIPETPVKSSPTKQLKTPHESSSTNMQLPRLIRKSLMDLTNIDKSGLKRKQESPTNTPPSNKNIKLDLSSAKISKARTALFPENIMPAKSFYPKSIEDYKPGRYVFSEPVYKTKKTTKRNSTMYLCSRKKIGRSYGQINAGVRHGIRKPKHKPKLSKTQILNAAMDILEKSPLNSYLDSLKTTKTTEDKENKDESTQLENSDNPFSSQQLNAMDSILKNITTDKFKAQPLTVLSPNFKQILAPPEQRTPSMKRPLSPEMDSSKKFFKSNKTNATITINKNIKLKVDNGEMSLVEKRKRKRAKFTEITFDTSDLNCEDEELADKSFTDILKCLEEEPEAQDTDKTIATEFLTVLPATPESNSIVLTASDSISASENSIQLHSVPTKKVTEMLLSPTSIMCDLTSGLALNSPKNQTVLPEPNLTNVSKKCISFPEMATKEKLFPIFYAENNVSKNKNEKKECQAVQNLRKIWKPMSDDQMLIDAGQKKFGHTQCAECKLLYHIGDPEDEILHHNYHHSVNVLKFPGWKNERVVSEFINGRVLLVQPGDPKMWWKKVREVLNVVNKELGFIDVDLDSNHFKIYLFIKNKQIQGCIVTEPKSYAYKMLPFDGIDLCTEETFPVKCGVSRIWVSQAHRKQKIATTMMNVMRCNYMYGHILAENEIAFSAPTEAGKAFATKYMKTDGFFVYMS